MDLHDAHSLLGLRPEELTPERVRRAYMRKLREHPPERDPDGFQRLRAAYELLREGPIPIGAPPHTEAPVHPGEPSPPHQPVMTFRLLVETVLGFLIAERTNEAIWYEFGWRHHVVPDVTDQRDRLLQVRWALTRQLVDIVRITDPRIVALIARGIRQDDVSSVRGEIEAYAHTSPKTAAHANGHLFDWAPSLYTPLAAALLATPRRRVQWQLARRLRRYQRRDLRWYEIVIGLIIGIAMVVAFFYFFGFPDPPPPRGR